LLGLSLPVNSTKVKMGSLDVFSSSYLTFAAWGMWQVRLALPHRHGARPGLVRPGRALIGIHS
jgi:hypothetical protein